MWTDKIEEIKARRAKRNRFLNSGCSTTHLERFQEGVTKLFNYKLPKEYIEFLSYINGIEYNGLVLYGVDNTITNDENTNQEVTGYIETNEIWYENEHQKAYMFFGDGNISWYCYDIERDIYVELDKPSGSLVQEFQGFYHMVDYALSNSLI